RDGHVTGVQTCALPICLRSAAVAPSAADRRLYDRRHQHRQVRDGPVLAERERRDEAQVAQPLPAVTPPPVRLAVLVSGGGTNLLALLDALAESGVARVAGVISSRADAGALERARQRGVPATVLSDPADAAEVITSLGDANL